MLLKMAYLPEYVARLVFILDDTLQVWKVPSDRLLVHPICKQQFQTSHAKPNRQQELTKYASLARKL